jgi:hypothetical protein
MFRFGPAHMRYSRNNKGYYDVVGKILRFGQSWSLRGYWTCTSHSSGLTCSNRAHHGWWLGRYKGYRIF